VHLQESLHRINSRASNWLIRFLSTRTSGCINLLTAAVFCTAIREQHGERFQSVAIIFAPYPRTQAKVTLFLRNQWNCPAGFKGALVAQWPRWFAGIHRLAGCGVQYRPHLLCLRRRVPLLPTTRMCLVLCPPPSATEYYRHSTSRMQSSRQHFLKHLKQAGNASRPLSRHIGREPSSQC